jgi:hypothetical protein
LRRLLVVKGLGLDAAFLVDLLLRPLVLIVLIRDHLVAHDVHVARSDDL